jgi:hypothetical protein
MTAAERAAFYAQAVADALAALAVPDPELAEERRIVAEAQGAGL